MKLKDLIFNLCEKEGISGFEHHFSAYVQELLKKFCDEVYIDALGSVHGIMKSKKANAKKILLDAHMDEIGLMVSNISDDGFLHFVNIGGVDSRILLGATVVVHGKTRMFGTVAIKPPHIQTAEDMKNAIALKDLVIDIGYTKEQASELVTIGDMVTFYAKPQCLMGDRISSKTLDDRAGVAVIIGAAQQLKKIKRNIDIEVLISAQEETGLRGAKVGGQLSNADMALAVDVSHGKTPDANDDRTYEFGGGVMIGVGPSLNGGMSRGLISIAEKKEIPHQIEVMGGDTGTNAWALQIVNEGIPCSLLSIPLRYMHTTIETISLSDAKAARDLIYHFVKAESEKRA